MRRKKNRMVVFVTVGVLAALILVWSSSCALAKQDWEAIEAAARKEGKVVIYSVSSRIFKLVDEFKEKYGVEIVGFDIAPDKQAEKFRREYQAGVHQVDVLFTNGTPELLGEFLPKKMVWNFVPDTVAPYLDDNEKEPLLVQRWSSRVLMYNTALNPEGPPIDNLWDLTREEWTAKVLTPGPLVGVMTNVFQTILEHPDEMAAAYEKEFGKSITLSPGIENAAQEWLLRFVQNKPVFIDSTSKILKGVADVEQEDPPIGWTTFSKLRAYEPGVYEAAPLYDLEPVLGVAYPTVFVIASKAPHPNAAKLLVRYMMEAGFWPWNEIGDYAGRSDVETLQVHWFNIPLFRKVKLWMIDAEHVYNTRYEFVEFYMSIGP